MYADGSAVKFAAPSSMLCTQGCMRSANVMLQSMYVLESSLCAEPCHMIH